MAEHRRVEPRTGLAGTGMATDVDRLQDIDAEYQRRGRAWRDAPDKGFEAVLEEAPAHGELEDEEHPDPRRRPKRPTQAPTEVDMAVAATAQAPPVAPLPSPEQPAARAGSRLPPDPRAAMLHRLLATGASRSARPSKGGLAPEPVRIGAASQVPSADTPPTGGTGDRKRRP